MSVASLSVKPFFAPRYWSTWALFALMRTVALLPHRWALAVGRGVGRLLRLFPARHDIARINIGLCFPELSDRQRRDLLHKHFASLGMGLVEMAICWFAPREKLLGLAQLHGLEHLQVALQHGRGAILLSAHFTTLEIGTTLLALQVPICAVYRRHRNPLFESLMQRARASYAERAIPSNDMHAMVRALRDNLPLWFAPDQDFGRQHSLFVPFFNNPAASLSATSRLAKLSKAPVVPFFSQRSPDGRGYTLTLHAALENFPSDNIESDTLRINQLVEAEVRRYPEHYLWVHRRFKTQQAGKQARPYKQRPRRARRSRS